MDEIKSKQIQALHACIDLDAICDYFLELKDFGLTFKLFSELEEEELNELAWAVDDVSVALAKLYHTAIENGYLVDPEEQGEGNGEA